MVLRETCLKRHIGILKIEPELPDTPEVAATLLSAGFQRSAQRVQPLSTIHIDLTGDDEAILARMKQKWRYNIRLAERKGVTVRAGLAADLPAIQALMDATGARDGFGVHNAAYHAAATALFAPSSFVVGPSSASDTMTWLLAEHEGRLLAAIAVFALGQAGLVHVGRIERRRSQPDAESRGAVGGDALGQGARLHRLRLVGHPR